jgi:poly(A) polymerase
MPAYVVGGYVRDFILKRPTKDIDVVVIGSGTDFAEEVAKEIGHKSKLSLFKNFGTANLKWHEHEVEFVGARKESYLRNSRKPIVESGTLEDDLGRRDFTINALAVSLNKDDYGTLIDRYEGIMDLEKGIIKTPLGPDIAFSDDPLRMMRAIRFASQIGFELDDETFNSIKLNKERLSIISQERITDELNKIILSPVPSIGFKLLHDAGVLKMIFPELIDLEGVKTVNNRSHKDNFYHTLQVLDNLSRHTDDLWLRWAAILHDIGKPATQRYDQEAGWTFHGHEVVGARMVKKIFLRLKLPMNEKMKFVEKLVLLHLRPIALTNEVTDSAVRRLTVDVGEDIEALFHLCRADITSKNLEKVRRYLHRFDAVEGKIKEVGERDALRNWKPPITGEIIMETFGLNPSRTVGDIKEAVREAILNGDINNDYNEAYKLMLNIGKELGYSPLNQ